MANIIISYRRSDSAAIAGRIRDRLAEYYGADAVFMDIDSIPFGTDFRQHIQEVVTKNHIMLALIGPKWIGTKKGGMSRISDNKDAIRIEIEIALKQRMPLIPVLVGGASMPKSSALPESLQQLCFLNAAEVDDGRDFHQHLDRLIRAMDLLLIESKPGALEQKSQNRPIRDDSVSLRSRDVAAAPKEQVPKNHRVQGILDARQSAEFRSFFCAQTMTMARIVLLVASAGWVLNGAADYLVNEKLVPAMSELRGLIAIPVVFAGFAASYMSLAQRYWQTFLSAICVILGLINTSAAWVAYQTGQPFDLEKSLNFVLVALAALALTPLRFLNAVGMSVFVAGLVYLFLILTEQLLLSTAWMQAQLILALFLVCAIAYFREKHLRLWFQCTEAQRPARPNTVN
jgi:TIR domain-containing protein